MMKAKEGIKFVQPRPFTKAEISNAKKFAEEIMKWLKKDRKTRP